jgi:hypothetical protein
MTPLCFFPSNRLFHEVLQRTKANLPCHGHSRLKRFLKAHENELELRQYMQSYSRYETNLATFFVSLTQPLEAKPAR